uniref:protein-serine/threonine phosphatase n=1 Tax=Gouania willdenowi TaxID=441366 RepID=A0A8C5DR42_GOUWI
MAEMESVQADTKDGAASKLLKKPSGLSVALGTPAHDGGGHLSPSRVDKNGAALPHSVATGDFSARSSSRGSSNNSLLLKRRCLKRNLSAVAENAATKMNSTLSSASLHTRSLDRKTLMKHRENMQLQPADRDWVKADLHRGSIHVHDRLKPSHPRPVLCTVDTTAGEIALRLSKVSSKSSAVMRIFSKSNSKNNPNGKCNVHCKYIHNPSKVKDCDPLTPLESNHPGDRLRLLLMENADDGQLDGEMFSPESELQDITCSLSHLNSNIDTPHDDDLEHRDGVDSYGLNSGSDVESSAFDDLSSGARLSEHRDSFSDDMILGTEASILSPSFDSATEGHDMYGSSSDELQLDCPPSDTNKDPIAQHHTNGVTAATAGYEHSDLAHLNGSLPPSSSADSLSRACSPSNTPDVQDSECGKAALQFEPAANHHGDPCDPNLTLYMQLHGEAVRRLSPDERPLQIQNDFLFKLGFKNPWRVQEEGLNTEIGSLFRFYAGKPQSIESSERVQLSGTFNVRKGKLQLPVNRWTRRQVILCGTCLIVSSVKKSQTGKMHILPLIGGKIEEVKKHSHCLAFSSAGPQSQTYYVNFDSFTEHLRWHRHAAKMVSQRIHSVDLSFCSLEHLPLNLFYSHDLTHLNLKHNFLPADQRLQQLQRFTRLRSLNMSNNHLSQFPMAICDIPSLTEVNFSCNYLASVPNSVGAMTNLQTLLLDGNNLRNLPDELGSLLRLSYLGLSFNQFTHLPQVLERLASMEKLCMAGNHLEILRLQNFRLLRVKHIDLRLNKISIVVPDEPDLLRHVTQLDIRDNKLTELDVSVFPRLELLHCERNHITSLKAKGCLLKGLYASNNIHKLFIIYHHHSFPSYRNHMESLPDWLCEAKKLEVLDMSHNLIAELPARLLCNNGLRKLSAGHNHLQKLPERVEHPLLEVLDVQHNQLAELPCNLFLNSNSLRSVNASANKLEHLPPSTLSEDNHSILQELYLTNNRLTDKCVPMLTGHTHLRVLHMAYNHLQTFPASKMAKLEELEEVDLSGNMLKTVPTTIMNCRRMHTLIAHSNVIEVFPEVMQLLEMKCVDLSCNELTEITLPENLPPKLQELDLTGNPRLNLDHKTLEQLNNIRCFRIDTPPTFSSNEATGGPAVWSHGYTEASGVKNKLCVAALSVNSFCGSREALYGVFDADRNVEVPYLLQCTMNDVLAEEIHKTKSEEEYMTNTFLVMQRKLGTAGQKLGGSAALCHIRHNPTDHGGCFTLTAANVGKCQAILCRDGKALALSLLHNVGCEEEYRRIRHYRAIITEDNKVNGVTDSTRIMGYSFLYPSVIPCPYVQTVTLTPQDEFFILGSRGLWDTVSPSEAVDAVRKVPDGLAAAKKLCTLAQGYGCTDSLCAVVVQLSVSEDCCSCCCSEPSPPPPSPGLGSYPPSSSSMKERPSDGSLPVPPSSCSEISSEISTSEMSSEVGSTASSDEPPQTSELPAARSCCALHPACLAGSFQRQLSSATFSSALSDNGLDSDDEQPIAGVFSNGSRVEVEADVHCLKAVLSSSISLPGKRQINGSVAQQEKSHNLIEVAADAPSKKSGGYFTAPAQPDPDDQFIIPPELEEEVKEIMKQHQQKQQKPPGTDQHTDYYDTPL